MAAQTSIKITSDTSEFKKSLEEGKKATSSFTKELRSAKKDALNLTQEFRSLSDEMKNSDYGRNLEKQMQDAIKKAGELQDTFADVNQEISNFASDTQFADGMKLMASSVGNVSSALVALTGDSENMKKVLMDVAKIQATVQAVKSLTDAFQKQNLVLLKNPYVLVASGIAALTIAIGNYISKTDDATSSTKELNKSFKDLVETLNTDLGLDFGEELDGELLDKYVIAQNKAKVAKDKLLDSLQKEYFIQQRIKDGYTNAGSELEKQRQKTAEYRKELQEANKELGQFKKTEEKKPTSTTNNTNTRKQRDLNEELREALQLEREIKEETKYGVYDFLGGAAPDFRGQYSLDQMKPIALAEEVDDDKLDFTSVLENDWVAVKTLKDIISELNNEMSKAKTPEAYKQYAEQVEKANQKLAEQTEKTDETKDSQKKLQKQMRGTASVVNQAGSAFSALGNAFQLPALNIMGVIGQAIANTALAFGDALAKDQTSKTNIFAFIAASVSAVATMATLISQIKSITSGYANGGIIQGATTIGDLNLARVNDGEMILNGRQQKNLFNMLNNGIERQPVSLDTTNVEFRLRGQELIGVIKNTDKKMSKI